MDFEFSPKTKELRENLLDYMDKWIYPNEEVYSRQVHESGDPHCYPPIMDTLKAEARSRGLWNLFLPHKEWGAGLTNLEYAPLAEIMGRSGIASEATNCAAPDTGNMEVLAMFGTPEQQDMWLRPLLAGEIRSAFGMTEPAVASSDATNISLSIKRDGDEYVLNGVKWFSSQALAKRCKIMVVMGKSDPDGPPHRQQSQVLVPTDTPGLEVMRTPHVFGYDGHGGHPEIRYNNVRVPASNLIANEGDGFLISQARLGPGRIHHCMRTIGVAERALDLLCERALVRTTFGKRVADRSNVMDWIAEARIELDMMRLYCLNAAWLMDTVGNKGARTEISGIKVAAPTVALKIIDRAIQVHGAMGVTQYSPLARMYANMRTLRIADGPDEVHKMTIARRELRKHDPDYRQS